MTRVRPMEATSQLGVRDVTSRVLSGLGVSVEVIAELEESMVEIEYRPPSRFDGEFALRIGAMWAVLPALLALYGLFGALDADATLGRAASVSVWFGVIVGCTGFFAGRLVGLNDPAGPIATRDPRLLPFAGLAVFAVAAPLAAFALHAR